MQWLMEHWEAVGGGLGTLSLVWKMLRQSDKAYRSHLASHFPTKREFSRLENKVDRLLSFHTGRYSRGEHIKLADSD